MVKVMKNKERYGSKKMLRLRGVGVMKYRKKPVTVEAIKYDKEHSKPDIFEQTYEVVKE